MTYHTSTSSDGSSKETRELSLLCSPTVQRWNALRKQISHARNLPISISLCTRFHVKVESEKVRKCIFLVAIHEADV